MNLRVRSAETVSSPLDQYMPTEAPHYRVTDIDFRRWADEGVELLMLDVEAFLGETGSPELVPEYAEHVRDAHEAIPNIALWTNKPIRTGQDRELVNSWGQQAGADAVFTPLTPEERKPSPINAHKAMRMFGVRPDQLGVADDKASAAVRGGYFAGAEHRAWTRPFGANRHIGDRLVRDPFEAALRVRAHLLLTPTFQEQLGMSPQEIATLPADKVVDLAKPLVADHKDKIVGFGLEDIALDPEILSTIKQPAYREAIKSVQYVLDYYGEAPAAKLKSFLYENGRLTADGLVFVRLLLSLGIAAANISRLDPETKRKLSAGLAAGAYITDFFDGPAARGHKEGATKEGGALDQNVDKFLSTVIDIFPLIQQNLLGRRSLTAGLAREVGITAMRRPFKQRGIDTSSVWSGKASTNIKAYSQLISLFAGHRYPRANTVLQTAATASKVASAVHAPFVWVEKHERKIHEENNIHRALAALAIE